jgi:hypothetical protein
MSGIGAITRADAHGAVEEHQVPEAQHGGQRQPRRRPRPKSEHQETVESEPHKLDIEA